MSSYAPPPPVRPDPPQPEPRPSHGLATAGFVIALIGAVLALVPAVGVVSWVLAPLGLVLSIVGLQRSGRMGGRGLAISGTILGALGLLICLIWMAAFVFSITHTTTTGPSTTPSSSSRYTSAPSAAAVPDSSTGAGGFSQGTYEVGTGSGQIAPGKYRTTGASPDQLWQFCMASREKGDGSAIGFPVTTNTGPAFVTVRSSDGMVEFSGSCTWTRVS
jgi:hypothetical protein